MAYHYCPVCGKASNYPGAQPHFESPCPQAVKESDARASASLLRAGASLRDVIVWITAHEAGMPTT